MAPSIPQSKRICPGRICVGATTKTGNFPYNGKDLGIFFNAVLDVHQVWAPISAEELGGTVVESTLASETWLLYVVFRSWNADLINTLFPYTVEGTGNLNRGLVWDTSQDLPGKTLLSSRAVTLLFVADNVQHHNSLYLPRAVPMLSSNLQQNLSHKTEAVIATVWAGIPPVSGGVTGRYDLLENITL